MQDKRTEFYHRLSSCGRRNGLVVVSSRSGAFLEGHRCSFEALGLGKLDTQMLVYLIAKYSWFELLQALQVLLRETVQLASIVHPVNRL